MVSAYHIASFRDTQMDAEGWDERSTNRKAFQIRLSVIPSCRLWTSINDLQELAGHSL
jgi:hypothetical protein